MGKVPFITSLLAAGSMLSAASWAPLPAELWMVKENPAKGIRDAVVLEKMARFNSNYSEYFFRIRVLSEAGRQAVEFPAPSHAYDFEGRTVKPDGSQVVFNSQKDFTTTTIKAKSGWGGKRTALVPPGVSSDCIVELRYKRSGVPSLSPLPPGVNMLEWNLGSYYYTVKSVVLMPSNYPFPWSLAATGQSATETRDGIYRVLTFRDLPAQGSEPFQIASVDGRPMLTIAYQPEHCGQFVKGSNADYWGRGVGSYFKSSYRDDVVLGSAYKAFAAETLRGLDGMDAQQRAAVVYTRLQQAWRNLDQLSDAEKAARPAGADKENFNPLDLEKAARQKETTSFGLAVALVDLLKRTSIKPRILATADRAERVLNVDLHNLFQLDDELIGVEAPGKPTLWLDTGLRYGDPGLIRPAYQGMPALDYSTVDWTVRSAMVPVQPPTANEARYEYWITVGEETDSLRATARLAGFPGWDAKMDYLPKEQREQDRALKEAAEKWLGGLSVTKAVVGGVTTCGQPFTYEVEGQVEPEPARLREVRPFPGKPPLLEAPAQLSATRSTGIFLPYLSTQSAVSHIRVPAGYKTPVLHPQVRQTGFGTLSWTPTVTQGKDGGLDLTVEYRATLQQFSATPAGYQEFKRFLAAVQELDSLVLVLEKAR